MIMLKELDFLKILVSKIIIFRLILTIYSFSKKKLTKNKMTIIKCA